MITYSLKRLYIFLLYHDVEGVNGSIKLSAISSKKEI